MAIMAIMSIMSIMAAKLEDRYILSYSCRKNEFPGKRYNTSNLSIHRFVKILFVLLVHSQDHFRPLQTLA